MQRILNDPDNIVDEMLSGFLKANSDIVEARKISGLLKPDAKAKERLA